MKTQILSTESDLCWNSPFQQAASLSEEQEEILLTQLADEESTARHRLLQAYTPLIVALATEHGEVHTCDLADLVQAGMCALLEALADDGFPRLAPAFRAWITCRINNAFEQCSRAPEELSLDRAGRDACCDLEDVDEMPCEPLSARVAAPETPEEIVLAREQRMILLAALGTLTASERIVLSKRYGLDGGECHTLRELADGLGVSTERIARLEEQALCQLRARPLLPAIQALHRLAAHERSEAA